MKKLYAIWPNDRFPNVLGGVVVEVKAKGYCTVEGYPGMQFKYLQLLPFKEGIEVMKKVNELGAQYHAECKKLYDSKYSAAKTLLKNAGVDLK